MSARPPGDRKLTAIRPTRRLAVALGIIAALSAFAPVPVAVPVVLAGIVVACAVADWVVARNLSLALDRTAPVTLAQRVPVPFEAHVSGLGQAHSVRVRQPGVPELRVEPQESRGPDISGQIVGVHRGIHQLGPVVARTAGPLGLSSVDHLVGHQESFTVIPDLPRARRLEVARRRGRATDEGRIRARLGLGTEFETIRDYSPDDDIRQVNWIASSRVGRPMSNQYRVEENRDVMFLIDTGRLMASPIDTLTRLDVTLDAMTVLAVAAESAGDRVGAIAFDEKVKRELAPRRKGAGAIVRALFDLEPVGVESDYERAFFAVQRHKRSLVVVFTDIVDEAAARTLIAAMPVVLRRHAVLVASCVDPDLTEAVQTRPKDVRDVMRAAVATDLLSSKLRSVRMLRALGASVVEAEPRSLGPACVQAYFRLKQRARL